MLPTEFMVGASPSLLAHILLHQSVVKLHELTGEATERGNSAIGSLRFNQAMFEMSDGLIFLEAGKTSDLGYSRLALHVGERQSPTGDG